MSKIRFDYLTKYNYYGRDLLREDELDDALGLTSNEPEEPKQDDQQAPPDQSTPTDQAATDGEAPAMDQPAEAAPEPQSDAPKDNAVQLDITQLVLKQQEMTQTVQDVLSKVGELMKSNETLKTDISQKIQDIENKAQQNTNSVKQELQKRNPTSLEQLQLRSMSAYPFSVKLEDYWQPTQEDKYRYAIGNAKETNPTADATALGLPDVQKTAPEEYILKQSDVMRGYDENYIKKSF